jgi:ADP-heptose:LPS heptosyltransferase
MKILFITANRVGDAVLTTGVLDHLVRKYPEAHFTIACGPYGADLFRAVPRLGQLIVMKKKKFNGHWLDLWKQTVGTRWDIIVDLRNSVVSRLLWAGQRYIHGSSSGKHKVVDNGAVMGLNPPPNPHIWMTDEAQREADRLLPQGKAILALGPAANWPLKQWPIGHFIELVAQLTAPGAVLDSAAVLVIADGRERDQIEPLLQAIPADRRIEIIGRDLQTAAACLKRASLYVGNDSGLMHLSAALGTPTLGLFGPGFPLVYGPWGDKCAFVTTPETRDTLLAKQAASPQATLMETLSVESAVAAAIILLARA